MAEVRPKWPQALDNIFRQIHDEAEAKFESRLDQVFNVQNSEKAYEQDTSMSGYGQLEETAELENIKYEDTVPGWEVTYTHKKFAKGASVSQEMIDDEKWGMIKKRPAALARSKMMTLEAAGADVFNFGFVAGGGGKAKFTGGDGQALFSVSHINRTGDIIQSNKITTALTQSAVQAVSLAMRKRLNTKGQIVEFMPKTLLVPVELQYTAQIIMRSTQVIGSNFNDINPVQGTLDIVIWPYLTSALAWFVLADKEDSQLNFFIRKDEGVQGPNWDFDAEAARWKSVVRFSAGFSDWAGCYGSVGDGS